jgi:hypothetical protein
MNSVTERIVYEESVRLLNNQETALSGLRSRAGTLLAAASLVTAFLAPPALQTRDAITQDVSTHFGASAWLATAAFIGVVLLALVVLWPYGWMFGHSSHKLMDSLLDAQPPADEATLLRHLSYYNDVNHGANAKKMGRLFGAFAAGCCFLAGEIAFWLNALAS